MSFFNKGFIWICETWSAADMNKDFHSYVLHQSFQRLSYIFYFLKTTESTEDTEKNGKPLRSLCALWLIACEYIPFYRN